MPNAFLTGFFLGLSLIVAIGAQNAFVLRQGILRQHVFIISLFCSISDSILILIGVAGISYFFNDFISEHSKIIFGFAALWLLSYSFLRFKSAFKIKSSLIKNSQEKSSLANNILVVFIFTFANPHVYLDTVILIGSISQQFVDFERMYFACGACIASFIWFFGIAYSARLLTPIIYKPEHWRILDVIIGLIIFVIAFNLAHQGGWV